MNTKTNVLNNLAPSVKKADKALDMAAIFWFLVALMGQWLFVYYIIVHFGGAAIKGDTESWNDSTISGHVPGDTIGNIVFAMHIFMAAVITFGGTLQLIPQLRKRALNLHRWNGRIFIFTAYIMAIGGLYLVWVRGATLSLNGAWAITLNAAAILIFASLAIRTARAGNITAHRKWALRLYLMVNGVWFFRIGFMAWIMINQGPVGSTENLDGPFDLFWSYANFLLPLAVLELYFYTQNRAGTKGKYAMAGILFLLTLLMGLGIVAAFLFMWKPYL